MGVLIAETPWMRSATLSWKFEGLLSDHRLRTHSFVVSWTQNSISWDPADTETKIENEEVTIVPETGSDQREKESRWILSNR